MIDENRSSKSLADCVAEFIALAPPSDLSEWKINFLGRDKSGFCMDFEVHPREEGYRPLDARFDLYQEGTRLKVAFNGFFA